MAEKNPEPDSLPGRIFIRGLRIPCHIGITAEERALVQEIRADIEVTLDLAQAAATDDLAYTVDYRALKEKVLSELKGKEFNLLETLASRLAMLCRRLSNCRHVRVRVEKRGALTGAQSSGVELEL